MKNLQGKGQKMGNVTPDSSSKRNTSATCPQRNRKRSYTESRSNSQEMPSSKGKDKRKKGADSSKDDSEKLSKRKTAPQGGDANDEAIQVTPKKGRSSKSFSESPALQKPLTERQQLAYLLEMTARESMEDSLTQEKDVKNGLPEEGEKKNAKAEKKSVSKMNKRNERGETQMHLLAIRGDSDGIKKLISQGADVNVTDYAGWTPLHEACNRGHYKIVKVLLRAGAQVTAMGLDGDTPLHDASSNGHLKIVTALLRYGGDPLLKNHHNETAVDIAGSDEVEAILENYVLRNAKAEESEADKENGDSAHPSPSPLDTDDIARPSSSTTAKKEKEVCPTKDKETSPKKDQGKHKNKNQTEKSSLGDAKTDTLCSIISKEIRTEKEDPNGGEKVKNNGKADPSVHEEVHGFNNTIADKENFVLENENEDSESVKTESSHKVSEDSGYRSENSCHGDITYDDGTDDEKEPSVSLERGNSVYVNPDSNPCVSHRQNADAADSQRDITSVKKDNISTSKEITNSEHDEPATSNTRRKAVTSIIGKNSSHKKQKNANLKEDEQNDALISVSKEKSQSINKIPSDYDTNTETCKDDSVSAGKNNVDDNIPVKGQKTVKNSTLSPLNPSNFKCEQEKKKKKLTSDKLSPSTIPPDNQVANSKARKLTISDTQGADNTSDDMLSTKASVKKISPPSDNKGVNNKSRKSNLHNSKVNDGDTSPVKAGGCKTPLSPDNKAGSSKSKRLMAYEKFPGDDIAPKIGSSSKTTLPTDNKAAISKSKKSVMSDSVETSDGTSSTEVSGGMTPETLDNKATNNKSKKLIECNAVNTNDDTLPAEASNCRTSLSLDNKASNNKDNKASNNKDNKTSNNKDNKTSNNKDNKISNNKTKKLTECNSKAIADDIFPTKITNNKTQLSGDKKVGNSKSKKSALLDGKSSPSNISPIKASSKDSNRSKRQRTEIKLNPVEKEENCPLSPCLKAKVGKFDSSNDAVTSIVNKLSNASNLEIGSVPDSALLRNKEEELVSSTRKENPSIVSIAQQIKELKGKVTFKIPEDENSSLGADSNLKGPKMNGHLESNALVVDFKVSSKSPTAKIPCDDEKNITPNCLKEQIDCHSDTSTGSSRKEKWYDTSSNLQGEGDNLLTTSTSETKTDEGAENVKPSIGIPVSVVKGHSNSLGKQSGKTSSQTDTRTETHDKRSVPEIKEAKGDSLKSHKKRKLKPFDEIQKSGPQKERKLDFIGDENLKSNTNDPVAIKEESVLERSFANPVHGLLELDTRRNGEEDIKSKCKLGVLNSPNKRGDKERKKVDKKVEKQRNEPSDSKVHSKKVVCSPNSEQEVVSKGKNKNKSPLKSTPVNHVGFSEPSPKKIKEDVLSNLFQHELWGNKGIKRKEDSREVKKPLKVKDNYIKDTTTVRAREEDMKKSSKLRVENVSLRDSPEKVNDGKEKVRTKIKEETTKQSKSPDKVKGDKANRLLLQQKGEHKPVTLSLLKSRDENTEIESAFNCDGATSKECSKNLLTFSNCKEEKGKESNRKLKGKDLSVKYNDSTTMKEDVKEQKLLLHDSEDKKILGVKLDAAKDKDIDNKKKIVKDGEVNQKEVDDGAPTEMKGTVRIPMEVKMEEKPPLTIENSQGLVETSCPDPKEVFDNLPTKLKGTVSSPIATEREERPPVNVENLQGATEMDLLPSAYPEIVKTETKHEEAAKDSETFPDNEFLAQSNTKAVSVDKHAISGVSSSLNCKISTQSCTTSRIDVEEKETDLDSTILCSKNTTKVETNLRNNERKVKKRSQKMLEFDAAVDVCEADTGTNGPLKAIVHDSHRSSAAESIHPSPPLNVQSEAVSVIKKAKASNDASVAGSKFGEVSTTHTEQPLKQQPESNDVLRSLPPESEVNTSNQPPSDICPASTFSTKDTGRLSAEYSNTKLDHVISCSTATSDNNILPASSQSDSSVQEVLHTQDAVTAVPEQTNRGDVVADCPSSSEPSSDVYVTSTDLPDSSSCRRKECPEKKIVEIGIEIVESYSDSFDNISPDLISPKATTSFESITPSITCTSKDYLSANEINMVDLVTECQSQSEKGQNSGCKNDHEDSTVQSNSQWNCEVLQSAPSARMEVGRVQSDIVSMSNTHELAFQAPECSQTHEEEIRNTLCSSESVSGEIVSSNISSVFDVERKVHRSASLNSLSSTASPQSLSRTVDLEPCDIVRTMMNSEFPDCSLNTGENTALPPDSTGVQVDVNTLSDQNVDTEVTSTGIEEMSKRHSVCASMEEQNAKSGANAESVVLPDRRPRSPPLLSTWRQVVNAKCKFLKYTEGELDLLGNSVLCSKLYRLREVKLDDQCIKEQDVKDDIFRRLEERHIIEMEKLHLSMEQELMRVQSRCKLLWSEKVPISACSTLMFQEDELYKKLPEIVTSRCQMNHVEDVENLRIALINDTLERYIAMEKTLLQRHQLEREGLETNVKLWKLIRLGRRGILKGRYRKCKKLSGA